MCWRVHAGAGATIGTRNGANLTAVVLLGLDGRHYRYAEIAVTETWYNNLPISQRNLRPQVLAGHPMEVGWLGTSSEPFDARIRAALQVWRRRAQTAPTPRAGRETRSAKRGP
jgi:hypothetical protein